MALCSGIKADGGRCRAQAMRNSEWCVNHHPDYAEARKRRASKGGKRGGRGRPQVEVNTVKDRLWTLAQDTLTGEVDRGVAAVVNQIFGTYLKACGVGLDVEERLALVGRLEELEEMLEAKQGDTRRGA